MLPDAGNDNKIHYITFQVKYIAELPQNFLVKSIKNIAIPQHDCTRKVSFDCMNLQGRYIRLCHEANADSNSVVIFMEYRIQKRKKSKWSERKLTESWRRER